MGMVNEEFDCQFFVNLFSGNMQVIVDYVIGYVVQVGNGVEEICNWFIVYGVVEGVVFEILYYKVVFKWYMGIGLV